MKLSNKATTNIVHVCSKFVDTIIGSISSENGQGNNIINITDFEVFFNNESHSITKDEINFEVFSSVPGLRLIPTIPDKTEVSVTLDEKILHFEIEKDLRYFLNINNIVKVEYYQNNIWMVQTVEEIYWFTSIAQNFRSLFLSRLPY